MRRDDDLIRELLFEFEASDDWLVILPGMTLASSPQDRQKLHHIQIMSDAGLLSPVDNTAVRLTSAGHDFLDAIRDDGIWSQTKEAAFEVGGSVTIEIIKSLATGFMKTKLSKYTGINL